MISKEEYLQARREAAEMIRKAGVVVTDQEVENMDVADFGLSHLRCEGAQILAMVDTEKIAMRVIALFPGQTEPEHWHTGFGGYEGKEETLRAISGELRLYLAGENSIKKGRVPKGKEEYYTVRREVVLQPGDTFTMQPGEKHWFQAGDEGAVFYTFSTLAGDARDPFTDPGIVRKTVIKEG